MKAKFHSPELSARRSDEKVQALLVSQLPILFPWLSSFDNGVVQSHLGAFSGFGPQKRGPFPEMPPKRPPPRRDCTRTQAASPEQSELIFRRFQRISQPYANIDE